MAQDLDFDINQYHQWNDHIDHADDPSALVHDLIAAHMTRDPSAPAVCAWDGGWTYDELDRLSSALASRLVTCGVACDDFVPILVPKSKWTAVAVLGVARSGAAFVLLDEAHPPRRLREICAEMRATLVVAAEDLQDRAGQLIDGDSIPVLVVGESSLRTWAVEDDKAWRASPVTGTSALYAIFTSGSTGRPKGAVVEHASLCAAALASGRVLGMSTQSRAFQFASFAFDPTIMDFLRTWLYGGCVCIPSPQQAKDGITDAFEALRANMASMTPSVARLLDAEALPGLRVLEFAGEPMLQADVDKWTDRVVLVNSYGNAECSVYSSMRSPMRRDLRTNNIGFPVACVAWIVDETDADVLLPPGQVGELVLEGPGVGRGYLHNTAMTAAAFITNPSWLARFRGSTARGTRLYKTGDLARYEEDGSLLCLGRKDTQTKIRGQRVELSEVEWHIRDLLGPDDDVVAEVVRWKEGRAALVACVRLRQAPSPSKESEQELQLLAPPNDAFRHKMEDMERALQSRVPAHMVPSAFIALHRVPLSLSGKTDRRRLRDHIAERPWAEVEAYMMAMTADDNYSSLSPTTEGERRLRDAFAHILGIEAAAIGLRDSFFRRGGDSILAMQLSAHCRGLGFSVTTQDVFQHQTIAALSDVVAVRESGPHQGRPLPLSPAQHMLIQRHGRPAEGEEDEIRRDASRLYGFRIMRIPGSLHIRQLESALQYLVRRHPALRTNFIPGAEGKWQQVVRESTQSCFLCESVHVPVTTKAGTDPDPDQPQWDPHYERLNLRDGPILGARLVSVQGSTGPQYLHLAAPLVVVDHLSWDIISRDLRDYLESGERGALRCAPASSFQSWLVGKSPPSEPKSEANGATGILPSLFGFGDHLALDKPSVEFELDANTATRLWQKGAEALRADPKELFLGLLLHSLQSTFPGQKNVYVLVEYDGRMRDATDVVGQYTTYASLVLSLSTDTDLLNIVGHVKDAFRAPSRRHNDVSHVPMPGEHGQAFIVLHWNTKGSPSASAIEAETEMCRLLRPSVLSTGHEPPASRFQPGTLDMTVTCTRESPSLRVQLADAQEGLAENGVRQWIERCRTSLAEFPPRWGAAKLPLRVSEFPQLDSMSQEDLGSMIEDLVAQNGGLDTRDIEDIYPTAFIQQGMLLSQARDPWTYRSSTAWMVRPRSSRDGQRPVDLTRLHDAWVKVAMAHSILRTVFVQARDGAYYQVVLKQPVLPITARDLDGSHFSVTTPRNEKHLGENQMLPWKIELVATTERGGGGGGMITCQLDISHALMDGDSLRVLVRDAGLVYEGGPRAAALDPPPYGQYIDYLRQVPQDRALEYWKTCLQNAEPCFFPVLSVSESVESEAEHLQEIAVVLDDVSHLFQFCETEGVTLFNVIQLAWAVVLQCYTGNDAVVFGYLTSGRDVPVNGAQDMVGPLINMLISRVDLNRKGVSVRQGLVQCRDGFTASLPHQHCALSDIYRALGHSGAGLFNTIITYEKVLSVEAERSIDFERIRDRQPTEVSNRRPPAPPPDLTHWIRPGC
jgi:amino acid adenylation domain-containing protein